MYVVILMCTTLVVVMGLSGLTAARGKLRAATDSEEVVAARYCATAALELAMLEVDSNASWRSAYTSDAWIAEASAGTGTYTWKLVDEYDGVLHNNSTDPVRVYGKGIVGNAVRIYSVCLAPSNDGGNVISNPGFEVGTTSWEPYVWDWSDCKIETDGNAHSGGICLKAKERDADWNGPIQDLTGHLQNDVDYEFSAWMRAKDEPVRSEVWILVQTDSGDEWFGGFAGIVLTDWTEISVTIHPTWTGSLREAFVKIATESGTKDFWLDDVALKKAATGEMTVVPGTWRREVLP
ncbi:MAG: carbohydrate binding domain-containing protein [Phycisphaerae bacterium]|nr:carbohydrate binding domain-containing protein [Phycisphaerae bacterium]